MTRRAMLRGVLAVGGLSLLSACAPSTPATPTSAPKPTEAPKPAAAASPAAASPAAGASPAASPAASPGASPAASPAAAAASAPAAAAAPAAPKPAALANTDRIHYRDEPPVTGTPKTGGNLKVLLRIDGQTLDPHKTTEATTFIFNEQVYDTLVENDLGVVMPGLAESWTVSPDGLTYTFKLRTNAKFHTTGRQVVASDVIYSLERVKDPKTASPRVKNLDAVTDMKAPDPQTVVMTLKEPFAPLLANLGAIGFAIVDKDVVAKTGDLANADGGSGPFKMKEWVRDTRFVVEKNPDYWRSGMPYLDTVTFTFNPDDNARAAAIRSAGVDYLYRADATFVDALKKDPNLKWYGGVSGSWSYLLMNVAKKPWDDVRVRQAVFWTLNRQEIMEIANSGLGEVLTGGFLSPSKWAALKTVPYPAPDINKAKALMAEAGQGSGFNTTLTVLSTSAFHVRAAQTIQQQLKAIGINIELKSQESGVIAQAEREGNFDLRVSAFGGVVDPDERLSQTFVTGAGTNYSKFSDKEVDDLTARARRESNVDAREKLYQQIQQILAERGPYAFTYGWADHDVVLKKVQGFNFDPAPNYRGYRATWLSE